MSGDGSVQSGSLIVWLTCWQIQVFEEVLHVFRLQMWFRLSKQKYPVKHLTERHFSISHQGFSSTALVNLVTHSCGRTASNRLRITAKVAGPHAPSGGTWNCTGAHGMQAVYCLESRKDRNIERWRKGRCGCKHRSLLANCEAVVSRSVGRSLISSSNPWSVGLKLESFSFSVC